MTDTVSPGDGAFSALSSDAHTDGDPDPEFHRTLVERVFPRRADVTTVDAWTALVRTAEVHAVRPATDTASGWIRPVPHPSRPWPDAPADSLPQPLPRRPPTHRKHMFRRLWGPIVSDRR